MEGLNIVYREVDARSRIVQYAISLALTALLLLVAIARRETARRPWRSRFARVWSSFDGPP